jgi:CobB/CobQ-like glutamine amidotransferase domain
MMFKSAQNVHRWWDASMLLLLASHASGNESLHTDVLPAQVRVAVLREEGSNGDREMASAIHAAGMEPWDITMSDLLDGRASLDSFQGARPVRPLSSGTAILCAQASHLLAGYASHMAFHCHLAACLTQRTSGTLRPISTSMFHDVKFANAGIVFVGGFSYADVLESAKGWAGTIRYNSSLWAGFQAFYARPDTWCVAFPLTWVQGGACTWLLGPTVLRKTYCALSCRRKPCV